MARGLPSLTALLGLLAVAGYQNRDKIAEMLGGANKPADPQSPNSAQQRGLGDILGQLKGALGGATAGGILSGGLGELIDRFRKNGQGDTADSWVNTGPNKPCSVNQLEQALGPEMLDNLSKQTGLTRQELADRLCKELPDAVDKYTPQGRLPTEAELTRS